MIKKNQLMNETLSTLDRHTYKVAGLNSTEAPNPHPYMYHKQTHPFDIMLQNNYQKRVRHKVRSNFSKKAKSQIIIMNNNCIQNSYQCIYLDENTITRYNCNVNLKPLLMISVKGSMR